MQSTLPPPSRRHKLELIVFVQNERFTFPLPATGAVVVGRAHEADIRIDHRSVSRRHLCLHLGAQLELEDLGSANGTYAVSERADTSDDETNPPHKDQRFQPQQRVRLRFGELVRAGSALLVVSKKTSSTFHEALRPPPRHGPGPRVLLDPTVKEIYQLAQRAAASDITVLILGETGVGKEVLAETIHQQSRRSTQPFLRLNCAALSESLLESELFGHERGAFTGAVAAKAGLFEATTGGTVLLDEIGELPLSIQAKLLRVLEERAVRRVGSTKSRPIDVRLIAATNRNLDTEIARGRFREDLFFRINKVLLTLPPLRERPSEVEPLARFFLHEFCVASGLPEPRLSDGALERLRSYPWPGNVRELKNVMERAPFLATEGLILPAHIPVRPPVPSKPREALFDAFDEEEEQTDLHEIPAALPLSGRAANERDRILGALETCAGNQTRAAQLLGISRRTLVNRLDELGLPRPRKRTGE